MRNQYILFLLASLLFIISCSKESDSSELIIGTWEITNWDQKPSNADDLIIEYFENGSYFELYHDKQGTSSLSSGEYSINTDNELTDFGFLTLSWEIEFPTENKLLKTFTNVSTGETIVLTYDRVLVNLCKDIDCSFGKNCFYGYCK